MSVLLNDSLVAPLLQYFVGIILYPILKTNSCIGVCVCVYVNRTSDHYSRNDIWLWLSMGCAACSLCVTDCSANNTLFWGKLFKLFTSSNWLSEWGLYWVSSHCYVL